MFSRLCCAQAAYPLSWFSRARPVIMPLKSKILNPAFTTGPTSKMSAEPSIPDTEPGDAPDDVLFNTLYGVRTIELNRPKKLNSLDGSMIRKIIPRLKEWEKSQLASVIIMAGSGEKAFCAGGDVAVLARNNKEGQEGQDRSKAYFSLEYQLDHLIATYPKPYIAYLDGITMGGGVGLGVHAPFRIATERTLFAMPETTIGFFPDVGGSFFLPRLDGEIGTYLALTSETLKGVNAFYAGIATHYIDSSSLGALTGRLAELVFKDYAPMEERLAIIDATIEEFATGLPHDEPILLSGKLRMAIDRCFKYNTIEEIITALKKEEGGEMNDWATETQRTLFRRSPTSLKVTLRQMRLGKGWTISETFQREYHIASRFMTHPDFISGVSARLINKPSTNPKWDPRKLEMVPNQDVESFFKVEGKGRQLQLIGGHDYTDYPFGSLSLPREKEVAELVRQGGQSRESIIDHFVSQRNGKPGVEEKVSEIVDRKCEHDGNGELRWKRQEL